MQKYYVVGIVFLAVFWLISWLVTGDKNPFAMAKGEPKIGENANFSASLVQMIVFTILTVFAYTTVFAARIFENNGSGLLPALKDGNNWLNVPSNLLILMGISVGTAVASRAIKIEQVKTGSLSDEDKSSLTRNRDGKTDLVKIQMLIWTVIAVVVYLEVLWRFMLQECYLTNSSGCPTQWGNTLPDIDTAFMALLGVSQGGYVVNQLSEKNEADKNKAKNQPNQPITSP